jgi:osomolarity two-component system response regulator SSK1
MEWGCMQALIDFDGWRKWKDFSQNVEAPPSASTTQSKALQKPKKKARNSTSNGVTE